MSDEEDYLDSADEEGSVDVSSDGLEVDGGTESENEPVSEEEAAAEDDYAHGRRYFDLAKAKLPDVLYADGTRTDKLLQWAQSEEAEVSADKMCDVLPASFFKRNTLPHLVFFIIHHVKVYLDSMDIFLADMDPEKRKAKLEFFNSGIPMTPAEAKANREVLGKMSYVDPRERQMFIEFVRAKNNLEPIPGREDSLKCSLSLLWTAMNIFYILDEDEKEKRKAAQVETGEDEAEADSDAEAAAEVYSEKARGGAADGGDAGMAIISFWSKSEGKEEAEEEKTDKPKAFSNEEVGEKNEEVAKVVKDLEKKLQPSYFRGTYKLLLDGWKEIEPKFVEAGISSSKLRKEFEEGSSGGGLEFNLSFLGIKKPVEECTQLNFDFGHNTELLVEAGTGDFDNTAEPVLHRLDEIFTNISDTESNATWYDAFRRGITMMGKSFDMKGASEQFKLALALQRKHDEKIKAYAHRTHENNVLAGVYEPHKAVERERAEIKVDVKFAWEKRKAMILKGLEDHIAGLAEEAVKDSGEGSDSATAEEGDDSAADTPSPPPPPPSAPEVDKIVVTFKYTDEERTLPVTKYVGEMKMVISLELGIPMKHQHLRNPDTDQIMKDHEVLDNYKNVILERPLQRSVWCQFFIDNLVQDVDEDEVLAFWGRLCKCTRKGRDSKGGPEYSEFDEETGKKIDPGDQFLYADDLRKVVQGFGKEPMSDEEAVVFINECRPLSAKQMNLSKIGVAGFVMTDEEYAKPENKNDLRQRVYYPWYYSALTDDTL